jgi:hypothetical protein
MDQAIVPVNAPSRPQHQPRTGKAAEADQINQHIAARIMPGNQPRQHAGVGRDRTWVDDGQAHARLRVHGPAAQHEGMGMPAADKHQIAHAGKIRGKVSLHALSVTGLSRLAQGGHSAAFLHNSGKIAVIPRAWPFVTRPTAAKSWAWHNGNG